MPGSAAADRLIEPPPFAHAPAADRLFCAALREAFAHHIRRCPAFAGVCAAEGFVPAALRTVRDLPGLPFIFVSAFKERDLRSVPQKNVVLELTSSGTTGQKSRILLDALSLRRVRRIAWQVFSGLGLADEGVTADYLCFTYDPAAAKNLGTAWTDRLLTGFTKTGEVYWAFRWDKAAREFRFEPAQAVKVLERFESRGRPCRIVGFPAFALRLLEEFSRKHGRDARLHPGTKVITGGGWKTETDEAVPKAALRVRIARGFGIPVAHMRDLFGMVEHGVPYVDCRLGNFHIPVYSRVLVRDPASLAPLPYGRTGLLQFITPYLTSYPSISLLTSDLGRVSERCRCGLPGPTLHIAGRAGVQKPKGCAASAATML